MGPGYFIIAIMGCADGSISCTPVATMPTRYANQAACAAAAPATLAANATFDFPSLVAQCQSMTQPASVSVDEQPEQPAYALHG